MKNYMAEMQDLRGSGLNPAWDGHYRPIGNIEVIAVHHEAQFRPHDYDSVQRYVSEASYQNNQSIPGSRGLQYHFKIDNVGTIFWIRPLEMYLWHCGNTYGNERGVAVCLDGNFEDQEPTREQLEALQQLLTWLTTPASGQFPASRPDVHPHSYFSATACCGRNLVGSVNEFQGSGQINTVRVPYDWPEYQPDAAPVAAVKPAPAPVAATFDYRVIGSDGNQAGAYKSLENAVGKWRQDLKENGRIVRVSDNADVTPAKTPPSVISPTPIPPTVPAPATDKDDDIGRQTHEQDQDKQIQDTRNLLQKLIDFLAKFIPGVK